jgi:hypothetical protein
MLVEGGVQACGPSGRHGRHFMGQGETGVSAADAELLPSVSDELCATARFCSGDGGGELLDTRLKAARARRLSKKKIPDLSKRSPAPIPEET